MIKLTTKLLATDMLALGFDNQEGILIQVRINPAHIVSYHPYPNEDNTGFTGTRLVMTTDSLLVTESVEYIDEILSINRWHSSSNTLKGMRQFIEDKMRGQE